MRVPDVRRRRRPKRPPSDDFPAALTMIAGFQRGGRRSALCSLLEHPEIALDAVHALRIHTRVPNTVTVTVREGFVTLEGVVDWTFQKVAAGLAAAFLDGVQGVSNLIEVRPNVSEGQIQAAIAEARRRVAEVDARTFGPRSTAPS